MTERGMQVKSDMNNVQWDQGDFPILCESCFGTNPYVRMQKHSHGGTCKMCDRPYTLFKWRPERGDEYRRTEICQTCSKIKNLCQTCILDLEFGLPSQLRDAVLAQGASSVSIPESEVNREYFAAQHQQMVAQGTDPWSSRETPNEQLLQIVRNVGQDRNQPRVKLPSYGKRDAGEALSKEAQELAAKHCRREEDLSTQSLELLLPPGVTSAAEVSNKAPPSEGFKVFVDVGFVTSSGGEGTKKSSKPPKPAGPPPPSAFLGDAPAIKAV